LGSLLMLVGLLALYVHHEGLTGIATFDIRLWQAMGAWPDWLGLQSWVWLALFLGFAIKVPMFPFHTWLPDAHVEAPTAGSVILAGVLLKMGTYGFLRFSLPMLPDATRRYAPFVLVLCVIGVIYGAAVALVQKDWKKLVAYSSVSHLGFCMLGIFALNAQGLTGGILQMINHGLSTGALFLLVGVVYERRHTRQLADYGGIVKVMPWFAVVFMIMTLSSIGMPLIPGQRLQRGMDDPCRCVPPRIEVVGGARRDRARTRGGVHALALSAHDVRPARSGREPDPERPHTTRVRLSSASRSARVLDRDPATADFQRSRGTGAAARPAGREDLPISPGHRRHGAGSGSRDPMMNVDRSARVTGPALGR
jgi:hypothetical protein